MSHQRRAHRFSGGVRKLTGFSAGPILVAVGLTAACSAFLPYSCTSNGADDADRLVEILSSDFQSVDRPEVLDDCDSGGERYVIFRIASVESATSEFATHAGCVTRDPDRDGSVFLCRLPDITAEFLIVDPAAGSSQGVVKSRG